MKLRVIRIPSGLLLSPTLQQLQLLEWFIAAHPVEQAEILWLAQRAPIHQQNRERRSQLEKLIEDRDRNRLKNKKHQSKIKAAAV